jgi:DNA-binding beta-propeller fold protein YncE
VTVSPITGFTHPIGITMSLDGKTAYVLNVDSVSVIDTKTNKLRGSPIDLSSYASGTGYLMGLTPDGKTCMCR